MLSHPLKNGFSTVGLRLSEKERTFGHKSYMVGPCYTEASSADIQHTTVPLSPHELEMQDGAATRNAFESLVLNILELFFSQGSLATSGCTWAFVSLCGFWRHSGS